MAYPKFRPNRYGLDPWGPLKQHARKKQALLEGEEFEEEPLLPLIVLRGMYSILFREALDKQKARFKKRGQKIKPTTPLPRQAQPPLPQDWVRAFNIITDSFIDNKIIKRPTVNKTLVLTPEGIRRQRKYYYEDQKVRSHRIEEQMEIVMDKLLRRLSEDA